MGALLWVIWVQDRRNNRLERMLLAEKVLERSPGLAVNLIREPVPKAEVEKAVKESTDNLKKTGVMVRVGAGSIKE